MISGIVSRLFITPYPDRQIPQGTSKSLGGFCFGQLPVFCRFLKTLKKILADSVFRALQMRIISITIRICKARIEKPLSDDKPVQKISTGS